MRTYHGTEQRRERRRKSSFSYAALATSSCEVILGVGIGFLVHACCVDAYVPSRVAFGRPAIRREPSSASRLSRDLRMSSPIPSDAEEYLSTLEEEGRRNRRKTTNGGGSGSGSGSDAVENNSKDYLSSLEAEAPKVAPTLEDTPPSGSHHYLKSITEGPGIFARMRRRMKLEKWRIAKLGVSMALAYGFVSNVSGCACMSTAFYIYMKKTGLSPLSPGQWKSFLGIYAGFFAFLNMIRPARFALSVAVSKYFERAIVFFQRRCYCSRAVATFLVGFFFNFCGSWTVIALGVMTASSLSGVPVFLGRSGWVWAGV